jgi:hypothetical protein
MYPGKYPALEGVKGTVPEPSDEAVQEFQRRLTAASRDVLPDDLDLDDRVAVARAMRDLPEGTFRKIDQAIIDAVAELTDGDPTREQIAALPFRLRRRFVTWLQRELMDPESSTAATRA